MKHIFTALLLCLPVLHAATKPNILFIAVDDLRPQLGCYGDTLIQSPNIDRIAARGIVFTKAYCQQAVCSPSRTAILTGLRPDVTKVWDLETHFRPAQPDCITLPQYFKMHGYQCEALSKIYHKGHEDGRSWTAPHWYPFGRAVDTDLVDWTKQIVTKHDVNVVEYSAPAGLDSTGKKKDKDAKAGPAFEVSPKEDHDLPDGATAHEAVRRLAALKAKGEPFFLAVGFLKPHLPFVAPKKYWDLYDPSSIPLPAIDHLPEGAPPYVGHTNGELHAYPGVPKEDPIPADFTRKLRHGYYACISYMDAQVGKVLDALEKEGLADNTIIVLWGDHGWQLGDHGLWHKHTNFELATRAPLLISAPGSKTAGQKCAAPVEFVDVYPTLAELCGLPVPAGLGGSSIKNFIDNPAAPSSGVAISQYPKKAPEGPVMGYSIRTDRYRATFYRLRNGSQIVGTELYDEQNDPDETVSLASKPEHQELLATLIKHLPPVGSDAERPGAHSKKGKNPDKGKPTPEQPSDDRAARFDKLDEAKSGKLTREYFTTHQSDAAAAGERFTKWDTNKDGLLSREEFITRGSMQPESK
jgi:arylsulfatase A-like enzyme